MKATNRNLLGVGFLLLAILINSLFMTRAYSVAQASVIAPFEYASLPISIMWGIVIFHAIPTMTTVMGALLTLASGLYVLYQGRRRPARVLQEKGGVR